MRITDHVLVLDLTQVSNPWLAPDCGDSVVRAGPADAGRDVVVIVVGVAVCTDWSVLLLLD